MFVRSTGGGAAARVAGAHVVLGVLALSALAGCASLPEDGFPAGEVTQAPTVDARAREKVARLARDVRSWLTDRYGPPTTAPARIVLLPDDRWLADAREAAGQPVAPAFSYRPGSRHLSFGRDEPAAVLLAPCFGSYARSDALARWIFYLEWGRGLPPWLREGLSETVGAALAGAFDPHTYDRTLDHLLPPWVSGPRQPFPSVLSLATLDPSAAARRYDECARVVAAATDGGEADAVRELLAHPPRTEAEVSAFSTEACQRATRFPSLGRVLAALEDRPRATSSTALLEAATPPASVLPEERPEAALDRDALEEKLLGLAASPRNDLRRLAVYGLGRLGTERARQALAAAADDPSVLVRATSLVARARLADTTAAGRLLDLARDAPIEEAPGRVAHVLDLFDRLTGYRAPPPAATDEPSLASVLGVRRGTTLRPRYRDIERRDLWLQGALGGHAGANGAAGKEDR